MQADAPIIRIVHLVRPPSPGLAPFIDAIWYFEGRFQHRLERILPSGQMQLLVNLDENELRSYHGDGYRAVERIRGAGIAGPFARHFGIDTAEQRAIMGVNFRPGGAFPFFRAPASAMSDQHVELDALWGRDGELLRERLLDAPTPEAKLRALENAIVESAARPFERDLCIDFAVDAFERGVTVREVTSRLGMTPRRFIDRFVQKVGLTPKRFARVQRFQRLLSAVERGHRIDWARAAVACGYFDQAHLIHDFSTFAGINPTAYGPRSPRERNHVPLP
jgi:AraC-like DNA-binding protein